MAKAWKFLIVEFTLLILSAFVFSGVILVYDMNQVEIELKSKSQETAHFTDEALITYASMLKALVYNFSQDDGVDPDKFNTLAKFYKDRYAHIVYFEYYDPNTTESYNFPNLMIEENKDNEVDTASTPSLLAGGDDYIVGKPQMIRYRNSDVMTVKIMLPFLTRTDDYKGVFSCMIDINQLLASFIQKDGTPYAIQISDDRDQIIYTQNGSGSSFELKDRIIIGRSYWTITTAVSDSIRRNIYLKASIVFLCLCFLIGLIGYYQYNLMKKDVALEILNQSLETSLNELQQSQKKLIEVEKIAALGRLVSSVAHEINTPLGNSMMTSSYISDRMEDLKQRILSHGELKKPWVDFFEDYEHSRDLLETSMNKIKILVDRFKSLAVQNLNQTTEVFSLYELVEESFIRYRYFKHFTWQIESADKVMIEGVRSAYEEILTNLISNSLTHGYILSEKSEPFVTIRLKRQADDLVIEYTDDGDGIPHDLMEKIKEPLFSTNRQGGSGGIGLNVIMNILTHTLSGSMELSSEVGQGLKVTLVIKDILWVDSHFA